jgi:hypothetical protein
MEGIDTKPSGELILSELEYLRQFEGDLVESPSAAQSLGELSDCGQAAPLSFPSFAPPPALSAPLPAPTLAPIPQEHEEEILLEWEHVQKIRVAAARAAEIARHHAEEVARLQTVVANREEKTRLEMNKTAAHGVEEVPEGECLEERIVTWPPGTSCVPPDYDVASHNQPVLHARAERVVELGSYFAEKRGLLAEKDAEQVVREAAEKAGGYQNLARSIREQITKEKD